MYRLYCIYVIMICATIVDVHMYIHNWWSQCFIGKDSFSEHAYDTDSDDEVSDTDSDDEDPDTTQQDDQDSDNNSDKISDGEYEKIPTENWDAISSAK